MEKTSQEVGKKIAFLDRDGVINKKAEEHCYVTRLEDFIFNEGIFDVTTQLRDDGFEFIVITNQRGIARRLLSEDMLGKIHDYMKDEFNKKGIKILDILYCPHDIDSCGCRKPKDGMLQQVIKKYSIDLKESLLISDSHEDIEMGSRFGIGRNIFVESDSTFVVL